MPAPYTAFFYGTLMHSKILTRVIQNDGSHLEICSAVLLDYTRHRVKNADYPGIVPYERGKQLFPDRELEQEERSVRGTLVRGLTLSDIGMLDRFEGDQYERLLVTVHPLTPFGSLNAPQGREGDSGLLPQHASPLPPIGELPEGVEAHTYGFQDIRWLEPTLWSFDDFVKKCAWKWYGGVQNPWTDTAIPYAEKVDTDESEVEKRRAAMTADAIVRA